MQYLRKLYQITLEFNQSTIFIASIFSFHWQPGFCSAIQKWIKGMNEGFIVSLGDMCQKTHQWSLQLLTKTELCFGSCLLIYGMNHLVESPKPLGLWPGESESWSGAAKPAEFPLLVMHPQPQGPISFHCQSKNWYFVCSSKEQALGLPSTSYHSGALLKNLHLLLLCCTGLPVVPSLREPL